MKLREWMQQENHTCKSLANELNTSVRNVEKWSRGERLPRFEFAEKIFNITTNAVTGHDLYEQQILRKKTRVQRDQVCI